MVAPSSTSITFVAAGASVAPGASVVGASVAGISVAGSSVAGASVAGSSVAGSSVAGASVAGASVAGSSVAGASVTGGASVVAGPQADIANAVISRTLQNINSFLFILLLSFDFVLRSQTYQCSSIRILRNHLL